MRTRVRTIGVVLVGCCAWPVFAQPAPDQEPEAWGAVPPEHLAMEVYAPDSNASAVILSDYGTLFFRDNQDMVFERHTRIKILTEAGYSWGTVTVPYLDKDRTQQVKNIEGRTYVGAEGGDMVTHEMEKGAVFTEDVDGTWKRMRFTLPALQPGSIIEYRYQVISTNPRQFPDWSFQHSEPVLWSEYRAEIPEIYRYVSVYQGARQPDIVEQEPYSRMMFWRFNMARRGGVSTMYDRRDREMVQASTDVAGVAHRWAMENVPALRQEPYMTTPEDFRAKIRFELAEIGQPSTQMVRLTTRDGTFEVPTSQIPVTPVMTSWQQLAEELMGSKRFGKQLGKHRAVRKQARAVVEGLAEPEAKARAVYNYLRTTMVWNGRRRVLIERDLDEVLAARNGDSAEIALLLVSMLREAGLEAYPVLISTRSHGRVVPLYPLLAQFNSVLAVVNIDDQGYLLDATDPLRPYDLLPVEALSGEGFLVHEGNPVWLPLKALDSYRHQGYIDASIDTAGTLTATLQVSDDGYSALAMRKALQRADTPEAFVQEALLGGLDEVAVESCTVVHEEAVAEAFKTEAAFSVPGYAQVAGDFMYLNPMPLGRTPGNPLRLPERTFPVDLAYPRLRVHTVRLALPEGYAVQEVPQNVRIQLPGGAGFFQRLIGVEGATLSVQAQFVIKHTVFEPERYQELRAFFEQVVAAEAEPVVLKRTS